MWSILNFGKYAGKMSFPEVVLHDHDWFFGAIESNRFEKRGFGAEARDLDFKARNIKIPRNAAKNLRVNYIFDHRHKFCGFTLVQVSSASEASPNHLDLSVVHRQKRHDKAGNKHLLQDFKTYCFGNLVKLTMTQCEEFFDNANFMSRPNGSVADQSRVVEERRLNEGNLRREQYQEKGTIPAIDAMFVWTPDRELIETSIFPLKGKIDVTTIPEGNCTRQHSSSMGACNDGWKKFDIRWEMAQRLVTELIYEDNIPEEEVRRVFMQVDEFATFPFSTALPR